MEGGDEYYDDGGMDVVEDEGADAVFDDAAMEEEVEDMDGGGGGGGGVAGEAGGAGGPDFPALEGSEFSAVPEGSRSIRVPDNRRKPLEAAWDDIVAPVVEHLGLLIRWHPKSRSVQLKTSEYTVDATALQKAEDFVTAFCLGFEVRDAIALLRLEDLYVETLDVTDVRRLTGDHLSRAIGRIAGMGGRTKYTVENATRTRIVLAGKKVHILGSYANVQIAQEAIVSLIMGSPPGKVYNRMRLVARRASERF
eukprot:PLAT13866.1.p1 GENE.PLAT13866.1~~PLAT13866.1.p1  ORF type:complete len:259 (+),score=104.36 PLAT13866.1:22-777(+)